MQRAGSKAGGNHFFSCRPLDKDMLAVEGITLSELSGEAVPGTVTQLCSAIGCSTFFQSRFFISDLKTTLKEKLFSKESEQGILTHWQQV